MLSSEPNPAPSASPTSGTEAAALVRVRYKIEDCSTRWFVSTISEIAPVRVPTHRTCIVDIGAWGHAPRHRFDIYALRIGNVIEPHEYAELFPHYFKNPEVRRRNAFCYIDARDLGQIVDLCIKKDGLGFQVFNAGNDHNGAIIPSKELAEQFFPGVPITRKLGEHEALFSNRKIREVLGFREQHTWKKYVKPSTYQAK